MPQIDLWPVHPQPQPDELLSSWVARLARGNGWKLREFYRLHVGPAPKFSAMDVDVRSPEVLVRVLAKKTGHAPAAIEAMALPGLQGLVFDSIDTQRHADWVLARCAPGAAPGQRASLQYCPACLDEGHAAYFRRVWRLAWATVCAVHGTYLLDRCRSCAAPVQLERVGMGGRARQRVDRGLEACGHCEADLRAGSAPAAAPAPLLWLQGIGELAIEQGFVDFAGNPNLRALAFFSGLRHVASGFWRHAFAGRSGRGLHERVRLEWASLADRQVVMARTAEVLQTWPHGFFDAVRTMPSPYTHFTREARPRPFWFDQVCRQLGRRSAPISAGELAAVKDVVKRREGVFTPAAAHRLYGRNLFFPTRHDPVVRVADDDVEQLIASIDHRIALIWGEERLVLLRDKTMFLAARALSLRREDLATASLQASWIGVPDPDPPQIGWSLPADAQAIRPWLWWYIRKVRPAFKGAADGDALFLSQGRGLAMSASLIGEQFRRAVRDAGLDGRLNFRTWIGSVHGRTAPAPANLGGRATVFTQRTNR